MALHFCTTGPTSEFRSQAVKPSPTPPPDTKRRTPPDSLSQLQRPEQLEELASASKGAVAYSVLPTTRASPLSVGLRAALPGSASRHRALAQPSINGIHNPTSSTMRPSPF